MNQAEGGSMNQAEGGSMNQDEDLISFALYVLRLMEKTEDWDADMLDTIADLSDNLKLSGADEHGCFKKTAERDLS